MAKPKIPVVSIIIPIYNTGGVVDSVVNSLLKQSFEDFEVLLINDGSTDNSLAAINKLAEKDKRILVLNQKNQGPSGARNTGIKKASGKYMMFIDSDDNIKGQILKDMVNHAENKSSELIVAGMTLEFFSGDTPVGKRSLSHPNQTIINDGLPFKKKIIKSLGADGRLYSLCNKIFVSDIIKKNSLKFDTNLRFGEDLLFILSYLGHVKKISLISDIYYMYRQDSATSVFSKSALDYAARKENVRVTREFIKGGDAELNDLFSWLQTRWFISYIIAIMSSGLSLSEKLSRIRYARNNEGLKLISSPVFVGRNKFIVHRAFYSLLKTPLLLMLAFKLVVIRRNLRKKSYLDINLPKI